MRFLVVRLAARGLEVPLQDEEAEYEEIQSKVNENDRNEHHPVGFCLTGQNAVENQVNQTVGERGADTDVEDVAGHEGQTGENNVDGEQSRSQEQEGELDRLGDTGQERGQCNREQQGTGLLFLFRTCGNVHCQSGARETAHHERVLAGQEAACGNRELRRVRGSQFGEEDVLCAHNLNAVDDRGTADAGLPERQIEDVVQAERDECALTASVEEGSAVAGCLNQTAQCEDAVLNDRPDDVQDRTGDDCHCHAGNRDKARAGKERQGVRKLNLIEFVAEHCGNDTGDNTAEYAHLQGLDAEHRGDGAFLDGVGDHAVDDRTVKGQHRADGGQHDQIENAGRHNRDAALLLCHAECDGKREDQREVAEDCVARIVEHEHQAVQQGARMKNTGEAVGGDGGFVAKGTADAEQNTCKRQDCDRQEQGFADLLGRGKQLSALFLFHRIYSFQYGGCERMTYVVSKRRNLSIIRRIGPGSIGILNNCQSSVMFRRLR